MSAVVAADLLRWRLPSFQRKVSRARDVIAACSEVATPYVAFSGGKDSLVALGLAASVMPGVLAIWTDDELEHAEQPCYIQATCDALGVPLLVKTGTQAHGGWFASWASPPYWREPSPGSLETRESVRALAPALGYDATILGLRGAESVGRREYLRWRGRLHQLGDSQWRCNPLAGWTVDEVWAAIAGMELPYNPVYDRLAEIGIERERQRVGPLPLTPGWILERGWPEMYRGLVARYGPRW